MPERMDTVSDIVKALGGAETVATMFGCVPNAVYNWTAGNRLPARTYLAIRDALAVQDKVAPDHLWAMVEFKPQNHSASCAEAPQSSTSAPSPHHEVA